VSRGLTFVLGVLTGVALSAAVAIGGAILVGKEIAADLGGGTPEVVAPAPVADPASTDLAGTYPCRGCIYETVELRDGGRAVVYGMGICFPTTFTRVGEWLYVASDKGDLGFRVVDAATLKGEGWAAGTYRRR
jgi:hypothetical protein